MKRFYFIGFLVLIAFDTLAQVSFKFTGDNALPLELSSTWLLRVVGEPWIYGALVGYAGAFFTWMTLLEHAPIGPAFAASHLEVVSVMAASAVVFGDKLGWAQLLGALLIVLGIVVLAHSEGDASPPASP